MKRLISVKIIILAVFSSAILINACGGGTDTAIPATDGGNGNTAKDSGNNGGIEGEGEVGSTCLCGGSCDPCTDDMECAEGEVCNEEGFCDFEECNNEGEGEYDPATDPGGCEIEKGIDCQCISNTDCYSQLVCEGLVCTYHPPQPGEHLGPCDADNPCKEKTDVCICKDNAAECDQRYCLENPGCTADNNTCPAGFVCNEKSGICEPGGGEIISEPDVMDFGAVTFGSTSTASVMVRNKGHQNIKIFAIDFDRSTDRALFQFVEKPNDNTTIGPGEGVKIEVAYTPNDGEEDMGAIIVTNDSSNAPSLDIPILTSFKGAADLQIIDSATGQDIAEANNGNYANLTIDFGDLPEIGERTKSLYIKNNGSGNKPLTITKFEMELSGTPFTIVNKTMSGDDITLPTYLNVGDQYETSITFTCSKSEKYEERLTINVLGDADADNDKSVDDGKMTVKLTGRCGYVPPCIEVSATQAPMGEVQVVKTPDIPPGVYELKVRNCGGSDLMIDTAQSGLVIPSTPFTVTGLVSTIAPNGEIVLRIEYAPATVNDVANNQLKLISNDPTNPEVDVNITAIPVDPELTIEEADDVCCGATRKDGKIEFNKVNMGETKTMDVLIKNSGISGHLIIENISIVGSGVFKIVPASMPSLPLSLDKGTDHPLQIEFAPTATNPYDATLQIKSNDKDIGQTHNGELNVPITGEGDLNVGNDTAVIVLTNLHNEDCNDRRNVDLKITMPGGTTCPSSGEPRCTLSPTQGRDEAKISMTAFSTQGDGQYMIYAYYENAKYDDCFIGCSLCSTSTTGTSGTVTTTISPHANDPNGTADNRTVNYSIGSEGEQKLIMTLTRTNGRFTIQ